MRCCSFWGRGHIVCRGAPTDAPRNLIHHSNGPTIGDGTLDAAAECLLCTASDALRHFEDAYPIRTVVS